MAGNLAYSTYIVFSQLSLQDSIFKLNPLSQALFTGPMAAACLAVYASQYEWTDEDFTDDFKSTNKFVLIGDCLLAAMLTLTVLAVLKYYSGVTWVLSGYLKDFLVVVIAVLFAGESTNQTELLGYILLVISLLTWVGVNSYINNEKK